MRDFLQRLRLRPGFRRKASPRAEAPPDRHGIVLLATGISLRAGLQADALAADDGEPLLRQLARRALATAPAALVVSVPADDHTALEVVLRGLPLRCVPVPRGMAQGAALHAALSVLPGTCTGALLMPCDRRRTSPADLALLLQTWQAQPERGACIAGEMGGPGLPAILPRSWWPEIDPQNGLALRSLLQARSDQLTLAEERDGDGLRRVEEPPPEY